MVTISKFSYENPRYLNLLKRRGNIPEEVEITVKDVLKNVKMVLYWNANILQLIVLL